MPGSSPATAAPDLPRLSATIRLNRASKEQPRHQVMPTAVAAALRSCHHVEEPAPANTPAPERSRNRLVAARRVLRCIRAAGATGATLGSPMPGRRASDLPTLKMPSPRSRKEPGVAETAHRSTSRRLTRRSAPRRPVGGGSPSPNRRRSARATSAITKPGRFRDHVVSLLCPRCNKRLMPPTRSPGRPSERPVPRRSKQETPVSCVITPGASPQRHRARGRSTPRYRSAPTWSTTCHALTLVSRSITRAGRAAGAGRQWTDTGELC